MDYSYDVRSPRIGEHCNNCKHYSNNYCNLYKEKVEAYAWCDDWINNGTGSTKV